MSVTVSEACRHAGQGLAINAPRAETHVPLSPCVAPTVGQRPAAAPNRRTRRARTEIQSLFGHLRLNQNSSLWKSVASAQALNSDWAPTCTGCGTGCGTGAEQSSVRGVGESVSEQVSNDERVMSRLEHVRRWTAGNMLCCKHAQV